MGEPGSRRVRHSTRRQDLPANDWRRRQDVDLPHRLA